MSHSDNTERTHTTTTTTTGGGAGMGIVVGALVVVVAFLAYVIFSGSAPSGQDDVNITIEGAGSAVEGAAEAVEGAVSGDASN
ncbi:hypothetical protein BDE40_0751 [Litoreibacter halocynthiae]|uniref:Uncharacterized protein n=2 Tax=Litoreibacter TaxID=947567 RepID=A0A4R7LNZ1_9RHOB|nr:hypothetical protein [Litoreibacter]RLJ41479.1 hypothetical protein BCF46_2438 [Litoreibacter meonggei]TDT77464.1 hypothetical protein BDE40_0751 [Litoreibacter halocynthiae]